jgi:hypothetical protein
MSFANPLFGKPILFDLQKSSVRKYRDDPSHGLELVVPITEGVVAKTDTDLLNDFERHVREAAAGSRAVQHYLEARGCEAAAYNELESDRAEACEQEDLAINSVRIGDTEAAVGARQRLAALEARIAAGAEVHRNAVAEVAARAPAASKAICGFCHAWLRSQALAAEKQIRDALDRLPGETVDDLAAALRRRQLLAHTASWESVLQENGLLIRSEETNPNAAAATVLANRYGVYGQSWPHKGAKSIALKPVSEATRRLIERGLVDPQNVNYAREEELLKKEFSPGPADWSAGVSVNGRQQADVVHVRNDV